MNKREELEKKWRRTERIILAIALPFVAAYIFVGLMYLFGN